MTLLYTGISICIRVLMIFKICCIVSQMLFYGVDSLERNIDEIRHWMAINRLKLSPDKTEFLRISTSNQLKKFFP